MRLMRRAHTHWTAIPRLYHALVQFSPRRSPTVDGATLIADLIETGLEVHEQQRKRFLEVADQLARSTDRKEQKRLKEELARLSFGE